MKDKIKKIYALHTIPKILGTVVLVVLILVLIRMLPILMVKRNDIPIISHEYKTEILRTLEIDEGEVLAAESDGKLLYVDTKSMNIRIVDKDTKKEWNAILKDSQQTADLALLSISYLGDNNNLYEHDSYEYCTALGNYEIGLIENGLSIHMVLNEGESERFYEYYPLKMPIERFEGFFLEGIKRLVEEGVLDETRAARFDQAINIVYRKSVIENNYSVANTGNPAVSAVRLLIELAKMLGYTQEMLIEDSAEFDLTVTFTEPASFELVFEARLDGDEFVISIPVSKIVTHNDFYAMQNIKVLPNFGAAFAKEGADGYMLVPDGAGALMEFNTFTITVPEYVRPIYDNDFYADYYFMPEYGEELMMPVFGMTYGQDEAATHGFLAIIEEGADTSVINTRLAAVGDEGGSYNKVFASFDVFQYSRVKVYGPYADNTATYLARSGQSDIDYAIRYHLYPENVTYFDMAMSYREYLLKEDQTYELRYPDEFKLYVDFIGALTLKKRFLGVPYDSTYSMTTYDELLGILKEHEDKNLVIEYSGFFNGGLGNGLNTKAKLVPKNGSKKSLKELREYAESKNHEMFYEVSLSTVYEKGSNFSDRRHAVYDYSNRSATIYRYFIPLGILNGYVSNSVEYNYIVSPHYLKAVSDKFLKASGEYANLAVPDLGHLVYADYRFRNEVSIYEAGGVLGRVFADMSEGKSLAISNPFMKNMRYGAYVTDISRESSDYRTFSTTIPFRQLVMNGLTMPTTKDVNMSSRNAEYFILQSVELGMYPKFTLSYKNEDVLKNTNYAYFYSIEHKKHKEMIDYVYDTLERAWREIGSMEIVGHRVVDDNVFQTEYKGGIKVITNYNPYEVECGEHIIGALGFLVLNE